jgi:hypothetical protein
MVRGPFCSTCKNRLTYSRQTFRTLQELIAPKELDFFDAKGNLRGTKQSLVQQLSAITRIDQSLLEGGKTLVGFSVAQKMSWAASRRTTRKEDEAYCLLGLFDLNMPLLYGEGNKAFRRLQEEIIRTTVDLSIFAWNIPRLPSQAIDLEPSLCGVLAHTPAYFADCGAFQSGQGGVDGLRAISTSNFGIDIRTRMHLRPCGNGGQGYVLPVVFQSSGYIGIKLRQVGHDQYLRGDPYALEESYQGFFRGTVPPVERFLLTSIPTMPQTRVALERQLLLKLRYYLLQFERPPTMFFSDPWPLHRYDHEDRAFFGPFNSRRDFGCINVVAHVEVPGLGRVVVDCRFSAFCWYKDPPENAQFGLTESRLYDAQFASAQTWVADWDRDSLQFMSKLNELRVPKQSGVLIETENPNFAIVMTFKAERVKDINLAAVHWRVSFDCVVLHVGDHPGFDKEWWNLDSLSQQSSVAPTAPYIDDSRVPDAVPGVE